MAFSLVLWQGLRHVMGFVAVKTADFDYDLPPELIAQTPAARRTDARLLVVDRATRSLEHRRFTDLPSLLLGGDVLIRNTARVLPARLHGERCGGGRVECLLLRPADSQFRAAVAGPGPNAAEPAIASTTAKFGGQREQRCHDHPSIPEKADLWWCLLRPGRKLPPGTVFQRSGEFVARVLEKSAAGHYVVAISPTRVGETVSALAERTGSMPLPPYIKRTADANPDFSLDRERYQTVFADPEHTVAVAAPTAGLHFTDDLLDKIRKRGVAFADVILHVGPGTFRPIETADVADHPVHHERVEIPAATRFVLDKPVRGRRMAVGTTSVRTVEHYARSPRRGANPDRTFTDEADLFLHPPADFALVDALITNFHLPRSTLLCLVAAFLTPGSTDGVDWLKMIYAEAVRERYRFLSYGDAMLIL